MIVCWLTKLAFIDSPAQPECVTIFNMVREVDWQNDARAVYFSVRSSPPSIQA